MNENFLCQGLRKARNGHELKYGGGIDVDESRGSVFAFRNRTVLVSAAGASPMRLFVIVVMIVVGSSFDDDGASGRRFERFEWRQGRVFDWRRVMDGVVNEMIVERLARRCVKVEQRWTATR